MSGSEYEMEGEERCTGEDILPGQQWKEIAIEVKSNRTRRRRSPPCSNDARIQYLETREATTI